MPKDPWFDLPVLGALPLRAAADKLAEIGEVELAAKLQNAPAEADYRRAGKTYPPSEDYPAMIYPNPLNPAKYVVLNTGLTIEDRGYNGDYGTPLWGDYAIVKVKPGAAVPEMLTAGLFDEHWQLAK
jgi:hypothetical protein